MLRYAFVCIRSVPQKFPFFFYRQFVSKWSKFFIGYPLEKFFDRSSKVFELLTKENEENALLLLRIVVEYMKQLRPQMINEVREFLQFVHNVYRQKASALDQIFLTKTFSDPTLTINEVDVSNIVEQICSSVQLTVKKVQALPSQSSITTDETTSQPVLDTVKFLC